MEEAILITRGDLLDRIEERHTRLYFGHEFCERLAPSAGDLEKALAVANQRSMAFTLVTPYLTDEGFETWERLLPLVASGAPGAEVVANDWGFFHHLHEAYPALVKVLGRLLTKQKRGPQLLAVMDRMPEPALDHFRRSNVDVPVYAAFLKERGVARVELDNLLQGMARETELSASLYYPWAYISTTRMCLTNSCGNRRAPMRAIFPCRRECRRFQFRLTHADMPVPVMLAGNTQFYRKDDLPEPLESLGIDRLVFEPEIPM